MDRDNIIKVFVAFFGISIAIDVLSGILELGFDILGPLLGLVIEMAIPAAIFYLIFRGIKAVVGGGSTSRVVKADTAKERKMLKKLKQYFANNEVLRLNDQVTLKHEGIDYSLISLSVFIRGEYVSTLQEYRTAFPSAYNRLINAIVDKLNNGNFARKQEEPAYQEVKTEPVTSTVVKDCQYYINMFEQLNNAIPQQEITDGLNKTQEYLKQINKVEKEFPESKEKTTKLYAYYLPMMVDILEEYQRLAKTDSNSKEFKQNEAKLIKTVTLITSALESISASLCEDYYSNMSVDIKTLESLLKKDGFGTSDLDINSMRKEEGTNHE